MARSSDDPVRHIVTFRVNREEKNQLEQLAKLSGRSQVTKSGVTLGTVDYM